MLLKTVLKTPLIYAEEFEEDLVLDILSLGKEIFIQPNLHEKYDHYVTNLTYERDMLKLKLEYEEATLSLDVRENPEGYGVSKITEKTVEACLVIDKNIYDLRKDLTYVNKLVNEANGALRGIRDKGFSLKSAVEMYKTGYWGELTAIPVKMQEEIDDYLGKKEMTNYLEGNKRIQELQRRKVDGKN